MRCVVIQTEPRVSARAPLAELLHYAALVCTQPTHLVAAGEAASMSYARSQVQLQLQLLHMWVEAQLAALLLPDPAHMQRCVLADQQWQQQRQQQQQQQQGGGLAQQSPVQSSRCPGKKPSPDLARALAAWRLAHTFLCKSSWSKSPFVAHLD